MPNAGQIRRILARALGVWESISTLTFRETVPEDRTVHIRVKFVR